MSDMTPATLMEGSINIDTGTAPERRFINPKDKNDGEWLHTQMGQFKLVGNTKDIERREVEAMLRHAPPYSSSDLKALNLENAPNSTMGEMPRRIAEDEGKWTDYIVSSSGLWQIIFPQLPGEVADTMKEQVGNLLNEMWMDDPRHVIALQLCFRQFSCYGIGPLVFTDCYDPTPIARIASDLKFSPNTRITLDNFRECSLRDTYTAQELYALIKGKVGELREKIHGWKRQEVMKILKSNARRDGQASCWHDSLERIELRERAGENIWDSYANLHEIEVFHIFVKEYEPDAKTGKVISHIIIAHDGARWRIIRDKGHEYVGPNNFLMLATDRVGSDMTIANLRGMGVDLIEHCRSMDVMHNASMYAGYRSSIPVYASNGASAAGSADQISVRPNGVIIPQGFTEVESHVDFQAGGWIIDRLSNLADRHQRVYDINAPNKGGVQRTKGEAVLDAAKEADARSNQILPIVRLFFEPLGREFFRRLFNFPRDNKGAMMKYKGWEMATYFWIRLERILNENGIPAAALVEHRISVNPANTPGGLDKKLMRFEALVKIYPLLQTQEQRNWVVNTGLISIAGHQAAKPYLNQNEPKNPTSLDIQIDSENADMVSGYQRRVFPDQDHLRHMGPLAAEGTGHIPFIMGKLAEIQNGVFDKFSMDALDSLSHQLRAGVTMKGHLDAHLAFLAQNPVIMDMPEVQGYFDFNAQLEQILLQSIAQFEKQVAEKNPDAQATPEIQAFLAKTRAEIQAMQMKTEAEIQLINQKHMVKLGNQAQTMQARHAEKNAKFILDEIINRKKAEADLTIEGMGRILDLKSEKDKMDMQKEAAEQKLELEKEAAKTAAKKEPAKK